MAETFRLAGGGPFHRLERAARLDGLRRSIAALVGVTWAPLAIFGVVEQLAARAPEPLLGDWSVHARLLVALPMFLGGEQLLDRLCGVAVARLFDEGFVTPASSARVRGLLARVAAWRDAVLPEALLLAVAVASGVAALAGVVAPAGPVHGIAEARHGPVRAWYALVSLPLFQFLLWRSLYRWALWVRVLVGLARAPLRLLPGHADRRAGLGFLKEPTIAYCAVLLTAASSVVCAAWETQIERYGLGLDAIKPLFFTYVLASALVAFAPLVLFVPKLVRARIVALQSYGGLVSDYTQRFQQQWLERAERPHLLGTTHIQSFSDLGTAYRENVERMQVLLFTAKDWALLLFAACLPAVPLALAHGPVHEVSKRILRLIVGAVP
jgi:hypothetical protein